MSVLQKVRPLFLMRMVVDVNVEPDRQTTRRNPANSTSSHRLLLLGLNSILVFSSILDWHKLTVGRRDCIAAWTDKASPRCGTSLTPVSPLQSLGIKLSRSCSSLAYSFPYDSALFTMAMKRLAILLRYCAISKSGSRHRSLASATHTPRPTSLLIASCER